MLASGARPKTRPAWKRLARPGFPRFWLGLPEKGGLVKPGKHGHSQDSLATLATKAWPTWPCYFHGRAFSATLVKKAQPNPGLKDSSHAWPGFFWISRPKIYNIKWLQHETSESLAICCPMKDTLFFTTAIFSQRMTHCQFPHITNKKSTKAVIYELYRPCRPLDDRQWLQLSQ